MMKTIHWYLARDLVRIWVLALFALTLMLTIFSVIEPLRKQQGITFEQVLSFFGFMMPSMLSLTLPVSALFAATITYGRFSQDNEHLACRAGGVSTMAVLQPAIMLGVGVTALSLLLGNYVAPDMMKRSVAALEQNPKHILYRQLETKHYFKHRDQRHQDHYVRADRVDAENDTLYGLVYAQFDTSQRVNIQDGDKVRLADVYEVTHVDGEVYDLRGADGMPVAAVERDALLPVSRPYDDADLAVGDKVRLADVWRVRKVNTDKTYDLFRGGSTLPGVPASGLVPLPKQRDARIMMAARAKVTLHDHAPEPFVELDFDDLVAKRVTDVAGNFISEGQHQRLRFVLENPMQEPVAWLTWGELMKTAANPVRSPTIIRELDKTRRDLRNDHFLHDLRRQIERHQEYRRLSGVTISSGGPPVTREFVLKADRFEETIGRRDRFSLGSRLSNTDGSPVQLEIWEVLNTTDDDGQPQQVRRKRQTVSSRADRHGYLAVGVEYDELTDRTHVYVAMPGEVDVVTAGDTRSQRFEDFSVGQLAIPRELLQDVELYDYETLFAGVGPDGQSLSQRPSIQRRMRWTREDLAGELARRIRAEIHVRLAYSSSCLLMVMLGAALGLIFRGGQFLTAFALAAVPGAIVIIFLLMGKGMTKKMEGHLGLVAIWGGIVVLAVATSIVYARLARR